MGARGKKRIKKASPPIRRAPAVELEDEPDARAVSPDALQKALNLLDAEYRKAYEDFGFDIDLARDISIFDHPELQVLFDMEEHFPEPKEANALRHRASALRKMLDDPDLTGAVVAHDGGSRVIDARVLAVAAAMMLSGGADEFVLSDFLMQLRASEDPA